MTNHKMRCHFSIILEKTAGMIVIFFLLVLNQREEIIALLTSPDFHLSDLRELFPFLLSFSAFLVLITGYHFLVWRKTFIYIDGNTFVVERNTINRKKSTFAISSIANINLERNLFELLLGTYRLKLDTDSLSTANSTDVSIVLSAQKAQALKSELLALMKQEMSAAPKESSTPDKTCAPYASEGAAADDTMLTGPCASLKEVLSHCFFNLSTGILFLTFLVVVGIPLLIFLGKLSPNDMIPKGSSDSIGRFVTILFLVLSYGYSLLKQLFSFYHFSAFRQGDRLIIRYGFLRKQDFTIPVKRINAVQLVQPPLARLTGRMQARLLCIGLGDSEAEKPQLTLCMKKKEFYTHMQEILPEFSTESLQTVHNLPRGSGVMSLLSGICSLLLLSAGILTAESVLRKNLFEHLLFTACCIIIVILFIVYELLHYVSMRTWLDNDQLVLQNGAYSKQIWLVPYGKVQFVTYEQNLISRRFGIVKGHINILASLGNSTLFFSFISEETKKRFHEILLKHV